LVLGSKKKKAFVTGNIIEFLAVSGDSSTSAGVRGRREGGRALGRWTQQAFDPPLVRSWPLRWILQWCHVYLLALLFSQKRKIKLLALGTCPV
jgi:hypothetical protein